MNVPEPRSVVYGAVPRFNTRLKSRGKLVLAVSDELNQLLASTFPTLIQFSIPSNPPKARLGQQ